MTTKDYDKREPIPGLPGALPDGEHVLWQGSPNSAGIARRVFYVGFVLAYFAVLALSCAISAIQNGAAALGAITASWHLIAIGALATGIVALVAMLVRKTTIYTITNKRVVMRLGMTLPLTLNLPFHKIASADVRLFSNGTGDVALTPVDDLPVTYAHLWPHVRGFHIRRPKPTLRSVENAHDVSALLVRAMVADGVVGETRTLTQPEPSGSGLGTNPGGMLAQT